MKKNYKIFLIFLLILTISFVFYLNKPLEIVSTGANCTLDYSTLKYYSASCYVTVRLEHCTSPLIIKYQDTQLGSEIIYLSNWRVGLSDYCTLINSSGNSVEAECKPTLYMCSNPNFGSASGSMYILADPILYGCYNKTQSDTSYYYQPGDFFCYNNQVRECIGNSTTILSQMCNPENEDCRGRISHGVATARCVEVQCTQDSQCPQDTCLIDYQCIRNNCTQINNTIPEKPCEQAIFFESICRWDTSLCPQPECTIDSDCPEICLGVTNSCLMGLCVQSGTCVNCLTSEDCGGLPPNCIGEWQCNDGQCNALCDEQIPPPDKPKPILSKFVDIIKDFIKWLMDLI